MAWSAGETLGRVRARAGPARRKAGLALVDGTVEVVPLDALEADAVGRSLLAEGVVEVAVLGGLVEELVGRAVLHAGVRRRIVDGERRVVRTGQTVVRVVVRHVPAD